MIRSITFAAIVLVLACTTTFAQQKPKPTPQPVSMAKSSAAYSEVLLVKTEQTAELESLLTEYTEDYPTVKKLRTEIGFLQKELDRLVAVPASDQARLTTALGKLMVRKCEAATELWKLQQSYADEHPDIKAAKRKVEIFESAIKEILG